MKLKNKNLDMIIANSPSAIGSEKSTIQIKRKNEKWMTIKNLDKALIARKIIEMLSQ